VPNKVYLASVNLHCFIFQALYYGESGFLALRRFIRRDTNLLKSPAVWTQTVGRAGCPRMSPTREPNANHQMGNYTANVHARKKSPRIEYRLLESQRIADSTSLAQKFPNLKSLKVDLEYFDSAGQVRNGGMKYKANLEHAKSVFCFYCTSAECVGGDYDLSEDLARAIASKRKSVMGEVRCQGVRHNKERKESMPCQNILRYKFSLGY
jgi:hypothetical protein